MRTIQSKPLPQIILLFGDEPQQKLELIDTIRKQVKNQGFLERQNFTLDADLDWAQLLEATQTMSLFSDKQYIELSMPTLKPGVNGSKKLIELSQFSSEDVLILIHGPQLTSEAQKSKWFKALEQGAWLTKIYELEGTKLVSWLRTKAQQYGLQIDEIALRMLADLCEGNLMAGEQELQKLALQFIDAQQITEKHIEQYLTQQSRYSSFQFTEELLKGNFDRAMKILISLEQEGTEPILILWSLTNEAQQISKMMEYRDARLNIDFRSLRIWPSKQALYQQCLSRLTTKQVKIMMQKLSQADIAFKSQTISKPFVVLAQLASYFVTASNQIDFDFI